MISSWDKSLETGNKLIDSQHRQLINLLDILKLTGPDYKDILALLDKLMDFTVVHFLSEENLMAEVKYPPAPKKEMTQQHEKFKNYTRCRVLEFRQGDKKFDFKSFQVYVEHFLKIHEFGLDRKLANWIRHKQLKRSA